MNACCPTCGHRVPVSKVMIDEAGRTLSRGEKRIGIRPQEARVLRAMMDARPGRVLRADLIAAMARESGPDETALYAHERDYAQLSVVMHRLRNRIADFGLVIDTEYGVGHAVIDVGSAAAALAYYAQAPQAGPRPSISAAARRLAHQAEAAA